MALSIRNSHAEKLARQVAAESGENITQAIIHSLEDRLERIRGRRKANSTLDEILKIAERCSSLPDLDQRPHDEILGYGPDGLG